HCSARNTLDLPAPLLPSSLSSAFHPSTKIRPGFSGMWISNGSTIERKQTTDSLSNWMSILRRRDAKCLCISRYVAGLVSGLFACRPPYIWLLYYSHRCIGSAHDVDHQKPTLHHETSCTIASPARLVISSASTCSL